VRYRVLVEGLAGLFVVDARTVVHLPDALRTAWLIDALYDQQVAVGLAGVDPADLFTDTAIRSGYRKVLLRATSRLGALLREAEALASANGDGQHGASAS
jgi:cell division protein ZapE